MAFIPWLLSGLLVILIGEGVGLALRWPALWMGAIPLTDRPVSIRELPRREEGQTPSVDWWIDPEIPTEGWFLARANEGLWRLRGVVVFHPRSDGPVEMEVFFTPPWTALCLCVAAGIFIGVFGFPGVGAVFGVGWSLVVVVGYSVEAKKVASELRFDWSDGA